MQFTPGRFYIYDLNIMHTIYGQTTNFLAGYALKANLRGSWIKDDMEKQLELLLKIFCMHDIFIMILQQ